MMKGLHRLKYILSVDEESGSSDDIIQDNDNNMDDATRDTLLEATGDDAVVDGTTVNDTQGLNPCHNITSVRAFDKCAVSRASTCPVFPCGCSKDGWSSWLSRFMSLKTLVSGSYCTSRFCDVTLAVLGGFVGSTRAEGWSGPLLTLRSN